MTQSFFYIGYSNIPVFHHSMRLHSVDDHIKMIYFQKIVELTIHPK